MWIIKAPDSDVAPPSGDNKLFKSERQANKVAQIMADKHPGQRFVVYEATAEYKSPEYKSKPCIISMSAKCSDLFSCTFKNEDGSEVNYSGYVPDFFPGDHYGDYVMLDIDIETGRILNWKAPTLRDIIKTVKDQ